MKKQRRPPSEKRKETMYNNLKIQSIMSMLRTAYTPERRLDIQIMNAIKKILNIKANRDKSDWELLDGKEIKKIGKNVKPDMKMMPLQKNKKKERISLFS